MAEKFRKDFANATGVAVDAVQTPVVPIDGFTIAEFYHQKYRLRSGSPIRQFLEETYPTVKAFADSTIAMRMNSATGSPDSPAWKLVLEELSAYGFPPELERQVRAGQ